MTRFSRWCSVFLLFAGCSFVSNLGDPSASSSANIGAANGKDAGAFDAGVVDAGSQVIDAGAAVIDAGVVVFDAGAQLPDASVVVSDAGVQVDAGVTLDAGTGPFALLSLDLGARDLLGFAMAIEPTSGRVGVLYYAPAALTDAGTTVPNVPDYELRYVEWSEGRGASPTEKIQTVQRMSGISLAFDPISREPVAAFLGGAPDDVDPVYWYQSDAMVARRSSLNNTWSQVTAASDSVASGSPLCSPIDLGHIVGTQSAHAFTSSGALYYVFRDVHNGQFPQQDWAASDVELLSGPSESSLTRSCLTGDHKQAYGGNLKIAIGPNDRPAVTYDQQYGGDMVAGQNVNFQVRSQGGTWSVPVLLLSVANTMTGASLAAGAEGYSIAVTDRATSMLRYLESSDGVTWSAVDDVWGSGTGGWYPSLARSPLTLAEPSIAFYLCSPSAGASACLQLNDELRVTTRVAGFWHDSLVDAEGGWSPKLGFFADGRRVIVYRTPSALDANGVENPESGALKIAVER